MIEKNYSTPNEGYLEPLMQWYHGIQEKRRESETLNMPIQKERAHGCVALGRRMM
jgi:hypothetical protein